MDRSLAPSLVLALRALAVLAMTALVLDYAVGFGRDLGFDSPAFALWALAAAATAERPVAGE
jgi:hypothetical protein